MEKMDDEMDYLTKEQEKIDKMNIQKNTRHKKFQEMAGKFHNNEKFENIKRPLKK
jgi:hypothetical protein